MITDQERALSGVVDAEKPCLILVSNKYTDGGSLSAEEITKDFLEIQGDELLKYYEDIKCIRLPVKKDEKTFQTQLKSLSEIVRSFLQKRVNLRKAHGNLFTQQIWAELLYTAVYQFNEAPNLQMSNIYTLNV